MNELKACPFCGGEMKTAVVTFDEKFCEPPYESWYLEHIDLNAAADERCPIPITDMFYETEAEAIEAWNTRAERTCHFIENYGEGCWSKEHRDGKCSICGEEMKGRYNYCPNCGARVTPKNSETTPKVVGE